MVQVEMQFLILKADMTVIPVDVYDGVAILHKSRQLLKSCLLSVLND